MWLGYLATRDEFILAIRGRVCWGGARLVAWLVAAHGGAQSVGCSVGTAPWAGDPGVPTANSSCRRGLNQRCSSGLKPFSK